MDSRIGGKTTMTLHLIAEAQNLGGQAAFLDVVSIALDPVYAAKARVDVAQCSGFAADNVDQAWNYAETLLRSAGGINRRGGLSVAARPQGRL